MRFLVAVVALFGWASLPAFAQQTAECRNIAQPNERLACYDRQMPPTPAKNAKNAKQPSADPTMGEDEALKARLRDICTRC